MRRPITVAVIGVVGVALVAVTLSACSSGSKTPTAGATGTSSTGGSVSPAGSSAAAGSGGSGGDLTRYCSAIKKADAQALMKPDVGAVRAAIGECSFADGQLKMDLYSDPDEKFYGSNAGASRHPLSGVGDKAIWYEAVSGVSAPWVDARQGTLTCSVSTPDDLSTTTLTYTGNAPFTKVTDTHAAAYAQKVGVLCADVFAAAG